MLSAFSQRRPTTVEEDTQLFFNSLSHLNIQPFGHGDTSVGMEFELQVAVEGDHADVDLPITIRSSSYFKNVVKRTERGDLPPSILTSLKDYLFHNDTRIWENSWVRLPECLLTPYTREILAQDLLADKRLPRGKQRSDLQSFRCVHRGRELLRVPISYLLKLALANIISCGTPLSGVQQQTGKDLLSNFLSDNTSPEILSFSIPNATHGPIGKLAAAESLRTLLLTQLLIQYGNAGLGLADSGQRCLLYSAPHAPTRQKLLNEFVPDGFYRHLFISPCLSGWHRGEEKHRYMQLCHQTLSRSQLNTITKLKDAGILRNNLVVLPNTSNTCLANNGTHVSLGSRRLTSMAQNREGMLTPEVEKYCGDLVIKIVEHFLPLFVNTYSAAPYRIDYPDFHPEKVLGFLPHELDYTHLRMIWRRWQKKAHIRFFGKPLVPFGPRWIDRPLGLAFRMRGDIVPDFRLIDYLVTLLSTETSPALNGKPDNHDRLKKELTEMGIFDQRMSVYLPYRQRLLNSSGYCGFEGRHYSLFASVKQDMAEAVELQNLITALAYVYIGNRRVVHGDIPDRPSIESERRQIFFAAAVGIPTFYVRADTTNRFLRRILTEVRNQRNSRRYKGYIRVQVLEYQLALIRVLRGDGAELIEQLNLDELLDAIQERLSGGRSSYHKIIGGVIARLGKKRSPLHYSAAQFNQATEEYYRTDLKKQHLTEALDVIVDDCRTMEMNPLPEFRQLILELGINSSPSSFFTNHRRQILEESLDEESLVQLARLCLAVIHHQRRLDAANENNL